MKMRTLKRNKASLRVNVGEPFRKVNRKFRRVNGKVDCLRVRLKRAIPAQSRTHQLRKTKLR